MFRRYSCIHSSQSPSTKSLSSVDCYCKNTLHTVLLTIGLENKMAKVGIDDSSDRADLRLLLADFLISCDDAPPCWYRVNSCQNNMLPDGETKALLPSMGDVFGLPDKKANAILLASGLLKWHGEDELLTADVDSWNDFKNSKNGPVNIDIESVSHDKLIGEKVVVVRVGCFAYVDPIDALALVKKIEKNSYSVPRMRNHTHDQTSFYMAAAEYIDDDFDVEFGDVDVDDFVDDDDHDHDDSDSEDASTSSDDAAAAAPLAPTAEADADADGRDNDDPVVDNDSDDSSLVFKSHLEVEMALSKAKAFAKQNGYPTKVEEHIEHAAHEMRVHRLKKRKRASP